MFELRHASPTNLFQELLAKLQEEHERQLDALQSRVKMLQGHLDRLNGPTLQNGSGLCRQDTSCESDFGHMDSMASSRAPTSTTCKPALDPSNISVVFSSREATGDRRDGSDFEVLELKGVWKDLTKQNSAQNMQRLTVKTRRIEELCGPGAEIEKEGESAGVAGRCACTARIRGAVISPNWSWRLYWECVGLILVCFDMINIPFTTVFEPPTTPLTLTMDWATLLFWTLDMMQSCFVGFYRRGELVMKQPDALKNYLKTWFVVDSLVVLPDWFLTLAGTGTQAGALSRLLRTSRAIRVLRLLRVMKLQRILNKLYDYIDNEYSFIIAELVKMMLVILVVNHVIACGWYAMGKLSVNMRLPSWITWSENFLDGDMGYQYFTSLHWTLTQFTPASMDVVARNIVERIYSIVVLLFAMVAFSSIVGTVTSSMTVIRSMKNDRQKQFWLLRRFLKQRNVSMDLTVRMTRFLDHQQAKQQKLIQVGKVVFLQQLSDQLARELAFEMFEPLLHRHPFFRFLSHEMKAVAARICQMALLLMHVATDDTVFNVGEEANKAFVIKSGDFVYTHISEGILEPAPKEKEWLAEVAIWSRWRYRGKLVALKPGELLQVDAARYAEAMSIHPKPVTLGRVYGHKLVSLVNCQPPSLWTDVLRDDEFFNSAVFKVGKRASAMDAKFDVWDEEKNEDGEEVEDKKAAEHLNGTGADEDAASEGGKTKGRAKEEDEQSPRTWTRSPFASSPWGMLCSRRFFAGVCFHPCTSEQVHVQQAGPRSSSAALW